MCLGATKGGAIGAEAVIFFNREDAQEFRRMMKRSGHLAARLWLLSAQIMAWLEDGFWLSAANNGNARAKQLNNALLERGIVPIYPVEGNMAYVQMTSDQSDMLQSRGFEHYFIEQTDGRLAARFVMSHSTESHDIVQLTNAIGDCFEAPNRAANIQ
jgi:threonine aldolase